MMKLRAIDIAEEAMPESPEESQNGKALKDGEQKDGSPIIKMPATPLFSTIAANGITETDSAGINGNGSVPSEGADDADAVTDPELLELLEQLSVTIDTANTVLDAAATAPAEAISSSNPKPEPDPKPDSETDDPPPLAAQFASLSPAPQPTDHKQKKGVSKFTTALIAGMALTAGIGWLLFTNPWLMEDKTKMATMPDTSASASLNEKSTPTLANVAPATTLPDTGQPSPQLQSQPVMAPKASIGQPVAGKVGQPVTLAINLPASVPQTEMSIMIQGIPDTARLSAGKSLGSGNWLLSEAELQGLTLNTQSSFTPAQFELDVILVRSDGKVPEVHKLPVTIEPAGTVAAAIDGAAPPSSATTYVQTGVTVAVPVDLTRAVAMPAPEPAPVVAEPSVAKSPSVPALTSQEVKTLLARANSLLEQGDVAGARLLLEYAAQRGSKQAMLRMGETYDPDHLSRLSVHGVRPDQDQAALWYDRAAKAGAAQ